ncbi:hypothetical protein AB6N24_09030, partial [Cellulomonas sp. 179-A 4D5 NHS]|uniref:hypothetical protein n=1 Tax=Cellulomonas sp. 179-A 4D5 NHS TaxID=3142378 RepID=UPI0039A2C64C
GILANQVAATSVGADKFVYSINNGAVYEAASNRGWANLSTGIYASQLAATSTSSDKYVYTVNNGVVYEAASSRNWASLSTGIGTAAGSVDTG